MKILRAYKTELSLNNKQISLLLQHVGCARWAYNWGLSKKKEAFEKKEKIPTAIDLHKELNKLKKTEIPWMYNSSKAAPQESLRNLDKSFQNFFREVKKGNKKQGFPKFKSKRNEVQSFRLTGTIKILDSGYIQLPRLGKLKLHEKGYLPKDVKILSTTISRRAGKWFVSIQVEEEIIGEAKNDNKVIGVDLGIKSLAVCSDGTIYDNPKSLKKNLNKLKRKQRQLSRKKKGSKNRERAKQKLRKLHYRISNIRKNRLHKATSKIINENQVIVMEDLKVSNMMKNHNLAQAISDVGMFEFRRQINYKSVWNNRIVKYVDTFFPSSKQCSSCGNKKSNLTLAERVYTCNNCGMEMDRDLNAAKNLEQFYTASSAEIYASGDGNSSSESLVSPSSKEESNKKAKVYILKR